MMCAFEQQSSTLDCCDCKNAEECCIAVVEDASRERAYDAA